MPLQHSRGPLATTVRDLLPNTWDMLIGATAAPIGQGSTLALVAAGLLLIWRGYLRWGRAAGGPGGGVRGGGDPASRRSRLAAHAGLSQGGEPIGLIWTACQVMLGSTLFAAVMLAGETVTSPMTRRGQAIYGFGVGVLTVSLRWGPVALLAGCWAVLAMNTLVPLIDWFGPALAPSAGPVNYWFGLAAPAADFPSSSEGKRT